MKRQIIYALLLLLTLWPLCHIALAKRYDLSPWKLAGWGMYATPRFDTLGMEVFYETAAGARQQLSAPRPDEHAAATAFLERHRWLGRLTRPDRFAATILRERPEAHALEIVVFRPVLERDTSMIVMTTSAWDYTR